MTDQIENIKRDIRIALDQNMVSTQLISTADIDTLTLDDIIESKIEDAARLVMRDAPLHLLDGGKAFGESISWFSREGIGGGYIRLPSDFLRLVSFQMSDWSYPVNIAITEDHPLYPLQSSRYAGIKGNPQRPVVALSSQPIGLVLEFYSCSAGEGVYVKRATYLPIPKIYPVLVNDKGKYGSLSAVRSAYPNGGEEGDYVYVDGVIYVWDKATSDWVLYIAEITFSEKLRPAIIYYAAYLTALSIGNGDLATVLLNTSKELMQ